MKTYDFKCTIVSKEIDLNAIAAHFGISKKFKWEEPLVLNDKNLEGVLLQPENKYVYIFYFGTIAFINLAHHEMQDILNYLKDKIDDYAGITPFEYTDDFRLMAADDARPVKGENIEFEISYDYASISKLNNYVIDIIATVLAKSVALERTEHEIGILIDEIEKLIELLDKGRLEFSDKKLAKLSSKILRHKYDTISYIMLLDKPDIAWKYEDAEDFFIKMYDLFELRDRYENMKSKSEVLMDTTEIFTALTHSRRGNRLEWAVIILIAIEIGMSIIEKFIQR